MGTAQEVPPSALSDELFGIPFLVHPKIKHTHTTVLLHGRGSSGEEFAGDLMDSRTSTGQNLREKLPGCRWVFLSSRQLWSTTFQEEMPAWFEAHSLTDIAARQDLQVDGLQESVRYVFRVVKHEVELLNGKWEKLVLGGISQGAAVGLWVLICSLMQPENRLGGFVGLSTWLPFAHNLERILASQDKSASDGEPAYEDKAMDEFARSMLVPTAVLNQRHEIHTRLFLGHGTDDAYVDVQLGKQAAHIFTTFGMTVDWREYTGADEQGHWLKEPEEVDDVYEFLDRFALL